MPAFVVAPPHLASVPHLHLGDALGIVLWDEEQPGRLPNHLGLGPAEDQFGAGVPARHEPVEIERDDRVVAGAVEDLAVPGLDLAQICHRGLALGRRAAQFEPRHDLAGQDRQAGLLRLRQAARARHLVEHAERAERHALGRLQAGAGIEAQMRAALHEGVVAGALVERQVGDDRQAGLAQGMGADRLAERRFGQADAEARLEPLPVFGHETDERDRRLADLARELDDVVIARLGRGIENAVTVEHRQTVALIVRQCARCVEVAHEAMSCQGAPCQGRGAQCLGRDASMTRS